MANTQGFEVIIQASKQVLVKALKGAWKSEDCPDQSDNEGRIPEFMDIPAGLTVGGFDIVDGQVQIPQQELDAEFAADVNGTELIFGLNTQLEIGNPPVPSAQLLGFHVVLHAKTPIGTLPDSQDVGVLLKDITRPNVWAVLDQGHPLDPIIDELLREYVHKSYEDEVIPHLVVENDVSFLPGSTCNTSTQIFDDESNINRQILTSFPDPNTLQISIPIYLRLFAFVPNPIGPITIASPMGIETRIIINAPFVKSSDKYEARFGDVALANVTIGPISGPGSDIAGNPNEANNYNTNKTTLNNFGQDLDALLSSQLKAKGVEFAHDLGNQEVEIPSTAEIETLVADLFFTELTSRNHFSIWTPTASNEEFQVDSVEVKVVSNSLNIALNNTGSGNANAITNFIPGGMEFSIAMSKQSLEDKIQQAVVEKGFNNFPVRFKEDGKDVDLNSLNISVVNFAIRLEGTVTVIDAVLGSIDVDASFRTDVGLHWDPSGSLDSNGFQKLEHHIIGDPEVDVDEGIAFWIIAIILAVISFGVGGVLIGVITIIIILVVKAIIENIGSDSLVDGVTGAIDGITAWPPNLSKIGRVKAIFFDPVDISTTGLVISGTFEVISSCESTQVVPAKTAGAYTTSAAQTTQLKALNIYNKANYFWNPGDGSGQQALQLINHIYDNSGIYTAKHGVKVTEPGGAKSRHFALVNVKNVPPVVNAGKDLIVNEGEVVTLVGHFEDVEYLDTHESIWNFGDNQPPKKGFIEETNNKPKAVGVTKVEHAWCDQGEYYVSLQVIDNNGGVGTDTIKVSVKNVPPEVTSPEKIFAYPCSPITLVGNFIDPGWCDTHTATWRFGDCSFTKMAKVEETNTAPAAKGTATASHTYKKCSSYYAECTVIDDDGGVGVSHTVVEVIELKNAHFNDGFTYSPVGKVANFWHPFITYSNDSDIGVGPLGASINQTAAVSDRLQGERYICEKCLVFDGLSSQRIITDRSLFSGIYQSLGTNPKWEYQIGVMYQLDNSEAVAKLGIDPTGGTDPDSANVEWSEGSNQNAWSHLLQRVKAKADSITVFLGVESTSGKPADCCFDVVELVATQNTKCTPLDEPIPTTRTCVDFKDVRQREDLPSQWIHGGIKFTTVDKQANRIIDIFPPDHIPSLQIRRGMFIEFTEPVQDVTMEFSYFGELFVGFLASDPDGKTLLNDQVILKDGKTTVNINSGDIQRIQLYVQGEGALSKICFRQNNPSANTGLVKRPEISIKANKRFSDVRRNED